jgi:quaternary ammonium compound-resistance protein SugE
MAASGVFLALAVQKLPLGTAYAIWTGIGAVGTVLLGMALFGEPAAPMRIFFIAMIVAGIVGLKVVS